MIVEIFYDLHNMFVDTSNFHAFCKIQVVNLMDSVGKLAIVKCPLRTPTWGGRRSPAVVSICLDMTVTVTKRR